ncbi:hypothetical protein BpHYR1_025704 [Brachionus plicatilis]|uniref:Uncharacterized protein n=1 Tax=Brachionus plicatilis TaxID=10195 RepID=A0A3M7REZ4_BRAPC|nr:hypothetical protein BpHYR1_025704 [Brachionus plicatilis]
MYSETQETIEARFFFSKILLTLMPSNYFTCYVNFQNLLIEDFFYLTNPEKINFFKRNYLTCKKNKIISRSIKMILIYQKIRLRKNAFFFVDTKK